MFACRYCKIAVLFRWNPNLEFSTEMLFREWNRHGFAISLHIGYHFFYEVKHTLHSGYMAIIQMRQAWKFSA